MPIIKRIFNNCKCIDSDLPKADFYLTVGKFFVWRSLWIY